MPSPGPLSDDRIERALVVGAHPDDTEFGAGGTVAAWVEAGIAVTLLLITRGEQGGLDDLTRDAAAAVREREQGDAAAALGVTDLRWLEGYRDGSVTVEDRLILDLTRVIRQVRPQRVLAQSPERDWSLLVAGHPDHLAAGEATVQAVYPAAQNPHAHPVLLDEGLQPWHVQEVWLAAHPTPDHAVDVTDTWERKMAALAAHGSQTGGAPQEFRTALRRQFESSARTAGFDDGRVAERFRVSRL